MLKFHAEHRDVLDYDLIRGQIHLRGIHTAYLLQYCRQRLTALIPQLRDARFELR
jgi:hypothetical protein